MKYGFSLVELSIVLVILGLLTGGILAGQSLIRASELRAVTSEYQRYVAATNTFRDKYFAIPGDMNNAVSFWTAAGACPGTSATPSTTQATCNGNGNGIWEDSVATSNEYFRAWQHLANAGLIEGSYSGVANSTTASDNISLIGTNVPRSKISNGGWSLLTVGTASISATSYFEGNYGGIMIFGRQSAAITNLAIIKPEEAWNIDVKMDDGKPGTGIILVQESWTNCHDAGTSNAVALAGTANYALNSSTIACHLIFKTGY